MLQINKNKILKFFQNQIDEPEFKWYTSSAIRVKELELLLFKEVLYMKINFDKLSNLEDRTDNLFPLFSFFLNSARL